jgi:hypothetical protein
MGDNNDVEYNPQIHLSILVPRQGWGVQELKSAIGPAMGIYRGLLKELTWDKNPIVYEELTARFKFTLLINRPSTWPEIPGDETELDTALHAIAGTICRDLAERFPSEKYSVKYALGKIYWFHHRVYKKKSAEAQPEKIEAEA